MSNKSAHRGEALHQLAQTHVLTIQEIASRAGYKYNTFFRHTKQEDLSFNILAKYGKVIGYDFSILFPEMADHPSLQFNNEPPKKATMQEAVQEAEKWKDKYLEILERHSQLLEINMALREELVECKKRAGKKG